MANFHIIEPGFNPPHGLDWSEWRHQYDVNYFVVCHDVVENGKRIFFQPLSPYFATIDAAKAALPSIHAQHPDAGISGGTVFYSPLRPADMLEREAFIARLHRAESEVCHG